MEYDNYKDNTNTENIHHLRCPKCKSYNVNKVLHTTYKYYNRKDTYVKEGYYCCFNCMYKDYVKYFEEVE